MITLVISSLFGLFHALIPEILKGVGTWFQNKHEYQMAELMYKNAKGERELRMSELVETDTSREQLQLIKQQTVRTGIRIVDTFSGLARPIISFLLIGNFVALGWYIILNPALPAFICTTVWEAVLSSASYVLVFLFGRRATEKLNG